MNLNVNLIWMCNELGKWQGIKQEMGRHLHLHSTPKSVTPYTKSMFSMPTQMEIYINLFELILLSFNSLFDPLFMWMSLVSYFWFLLCAFELPINSILKLNWTLLWLCVFGPTFWGWHFGVSMIKVLVKKLHKTSAFLRRSVRTF